LSGVLCCSASDGTLNPGGVRFGSAEIYHIGQLQLVFIYVYSTVFYKIKMESTLSMNKTTTSAR